MSSTLFPSERLAPSNPQGADDKDGKGAEEVRNASLATSLGPWAITDRMLQIRDDDNKMIASKNW